MPSASPHSRARRHEPLAALTGKMRREETYHLLHAEAWLRRLADAPPPASDRLATSLRELWPDAQEVFAPLLEEEELVRSGLLAEPMRAMHAAWMSKVRPTLEPIAGELPDSAPSLDGRTRRTDEFAWLHREFTMVSGSDAEASW